MKKLESIFVPLIFGAIIVLCLYGLIGVVLIVAPYITARSFFYGVIFLLCTYGAYYIYKNYEQ